MISFEESNNPTKYIDPELIDVPFDRFSYEQCIMDTWGILDDLDVLIDHVCESDKVDVDNVSNVLIGIKALYQMRFEKLFAYYEASIR